MKNFEKLGEDLLKRLLTFEERLKAPNKSEEDLEASQQSEPKQEDKQEDKEQSENLLYDIF